MSDTDYPTGVSVIVCTYNGKERIARTLDHFVSQAAEPLSKWEVIVVDNNSTDGTGQTVRDWNRGRTDLDLRLVDEPKLGLAHARRRGVADARYSIISFVDDDNWVSSTWISQILAFFSSHPEAAALGAYAEPVFETDPPGWFSRFKASYAVSMDAGVARDVTEDITPLHGAGLSIRRSALDLLHGRQFTLVGRTGKTLTAGEDSELCLLLRAMGWKLWFDPDLRIKHYLPAYRLTWSYLRALHRGFGMAGPYLDAYKFPLHRPNHGIRSSVKRWWLLQVIRSLWSLVKYGSRVFLQSFRQTEGCDHVLLMEAHLGRIKSLCSLRGQYCKLMV